MFPVKPVRLVTCPSLAFLTDGPADGPADESRRRVPPTSPADESRRRVPTVAGWRRDGLARSRNAAVRQEVPLLTGSDVAGSVPWEVAPLVECGVEPLDAPRAATTSAVRFLGADPVGAPPAVVTYDADPRDHPEVLARPAAVVIGGVRVK